MGQLLFGDKMKRIILFSLLFLFRCQKGAIIEKRYVPSIFEKNSVKTSEDTEEEYPTVLAKPMPHIVTYHIDWKNGPPKELLYSSQLRNLINEIRTNVRSTPKVVKPSVVRISIDPRDFRHRVMEDNMSHYIMRKSF